MFKEHHIQKSDCPKKKGQRDNIFEPINRGTKIKLELNMYLI